MMTIGSPYVTHLRLTHLRLTMTLIAGVIVCGSEQAAAAEPPQICDKAVSTPEINLCSERAWQAADAKLNAAFAKTIGAIRKSDQAKPYDPKRWEQALRASQRAWVAFRDADCKELVPMSWTGGTGTTVAVLDCMIDLTRVRTKTLMEIYKPN